MTKPHCQVNLVQIPDTHSSLMRSQFGQLNVDESAVHFSFNKTNIFLSSSLRSTPMWESSVVTKRLELLLTYIRSNPA